MGNRKVNIMPMAGEGTRFKKKGFTIPKPLIDIHGKPMFIRSANSMPDADLWIFICQKKIFDDELILHHIKKNFINYEFICLDKLTDGQARTCSLAKEFLLDNNNNGFFCSLDISKSIQVPRIYVNDINQTDEVFD